MAPVSRGLPLYGRTGSINAVARDRVMSIFLFLSIDESRCKIELQMGLIRDQGQKQRFSSCERARHGTRDRRLHVRALRWLVTGILVSLTATAETSVRAPSLDDFFSEPELVSAAISPSGRQVAMVHRREDADRILVLDVDSGQSRAIVQFDRKALGEGTEAHIRAVYWKSDERLLFRTGGTVESANATFSRRTYSRLGSRIFAVDRDGHNMVRLLADVDRNATRGTLDFGRIESLLPRDPNHVMMSVFGYTGGGLLKVDLRTGQGEMVEGPERDVDDWWLDLDGNPIVKVESSRGAVRYYSKQPDGQWKKFHSIRYDELDQLPEYTAVGPSTQPQKYFVIARPEGRDRKGLYLYDLLAGSFSEPVVENPRYDLDSAAIDRDGTRVVRTCRIENTEVCEFADPAINSHLRAIRKHFTDTANVYVIDTSQDQRAILLAVDGVSQAPAIYLYEVARRNVTLLGHVQPDLEGRALPTGEVVTWRAGDGLELTGYLTRPHGASEAHALPLVVLPHGGPEQRDQLQFNVETQYLASLGYAVFQPNFRGSGGFGQAYAKLGYGQWGRRMQDDITDGVRALVERGVADPKRICIVGASYGGYAALAGATLTPDLYRCVVSRAGPSDLEDFVRFRRVRWGVDSEGYRYWLDAIGDPDNDAARLAATSPARLASSVAAPVLLIHGGSDFVVPIEQSRKMKKALEKAHKPVELIEVPDEGHSGWSEADERRALEATGRFVRKHLGPGFEAAPVPASN
jgi:dipeptidyl aminopeptidase/acylaminoacyl peptidase